MERWLPQTHVFAQCMVIHGRLPPLGELPRLGPGLVLAWLAAGPWLASPVAMTQVFHL